MALTSWVYSHDASNATVSDIISGCHDNDGDEGWAGLRQILPRNLQGPGRGQTEHYKHASTCHIRSHQQGHCIALTTSSAKTLYCIYYGEATDDATARCLSHGCSMSLPCTYTLRRLNPSHKPNTERLYRLASNHTSPPERMT